MLQFNLLAFVPFGILLGTALIAALISTFIKLAHGRTQRRGEPKPDAQILYFPPPAPRRRLAGEAARQPAQLALYARTTLAG